MPHETTKPTGQTVGVSREPGRPHLTDEVYAYLTEPLDAPQDAEWERIRFALFRIAMTDQGEKGTRARRVLAQTTGVFLPESVYRIVWAFGLNLAGLLYGREPLDRARLARLLNEVIREATRIHSEARAA